MNARPTNAQPKLSYMTPRLIYIYLAHGTLAAYVQKYVFDCYWSFNHPCLSATPCVCHTSASYSIILISMSEPKATATR
jgi:hypothetical protein